MNRVCYLMSGPAHLPYLLVSLHTLRKHWDGEVVVFAYPESFNIVKLIAQDEKLNIEVQKWEPTYKEKNSQFINKILMVQSFAQQEESGVVLYLDADTTIHGCLDRLFDGALLHGFAATQFSGWNTLGGTMQKRLQSLADFPEIDKRYLAQVMDNEYPSVNGGVWCAKPESQVLQTWFDWSWAARSTFICDEKVLHLMVPKYSPEELIVLPGRFNCSPKYQPIDLANEDVVIYHYHGDCCVRPNKSSRGFEVWWGLYQHCLQNGVGHINRWMGRIKDNRWINEMIRDGVVKCHKGIPI
ncbi:hypothetical protein M0R72_14375 [Candidatus Pacearchaeota archaeon]|jgi:hypothetical protein|nr:hypothetical protein [Candidatus Pacearchaeota archaeon]